MTVGELRKKLEGVPDDLQVEMADGQAVEFAEVVCAVFVISDPEKPEERGAMKRCEAMLEKLDGTFEQCDAPAGAGSDSYWECQKLGKAISPKKATGE
jgi:hypothetical protein